MKSEIDAIKLPYVSHFDPEEKQLSHRSGVLRRQWTWLLAPMDERNSTTEFTAGPDTA